MIAGIIKVEVIKGYQPSQRPGPRPSLFWISQKPNLMNVLLYIYFFFKKIKTKTASPVP